MPLVERERSVATLANLRVNLGLNSAAYAKGMTKVTARTRAFSAVIGRVGGLLAGVFAARQIARFASANVRAFVVQEEAISDLNAALKATGQFSEQASRSIQRAAADMQQITDKGDEALIAATASLSLLSTGLNVQQLQDAQKAIIGIADVFLKGDVTNSALLLGKTIGSTTNALTRYGIQIDVNASQGEKLNEILEQTGGFFDLALARARTTGGQFRQLQNATGDLQETLGLLSIQILTSAGNLGDLKTKVVEFDRTIQDNRAEIFFWGNAFIEVTKLMLRLAGGALKGVGEAIGNVGAVMVAIATFDIQLLKTAMSSLSTDLIEDWADMLDAIKDFTEGVKRTVPEDFARAGAAAGPALTDPVIESVTQMAKDLDRMAFDAGVGFVRSFIQGTESVLDLLGRALSRLAEDFIIGSFEKTLFPATATAGAASLGSAASASSSAVVVNQTVNFNPGFVDGASGAAWLRANKGAIALAMREATQDAGGVRRLLG
jgi:hypothetical protein